MLRPKGEKTNLGFMTKSTDGRIVYPNESTISLDASNDTSNDSSLNEVTNFDNILFNGRVLSKAQFNLIGRFVHTNSPEVLVSVSVRGCGGMHGAYAITFPSKS